MIQSVEPLEFHGCDSWDVSLDHNDSATLNEPKFDVLSDQALKAKLEEARKNTPRFLFRGWKSSFDCPSGGLVGLNFTKAVTPLAYLDRTSSSVPSVLDLGASALTSMAIDHLSGGTGGEPTQSS